MKKLHLILAGALLASPLLSHANPGCGLGSQVFEGEEGLFAHVLAATTNGTSGNQTFGMTSGTLGCDVTEPVVAAAVFINENMDEIAENMANGDGEALLTLAELLEVESNSEFASLTQENFATIFSHENITAEEVVSNLHSVMQS